MGVAPQREKDVEYTLTLPYDLSQQIEAKAQVLGFDCATVIATLLKFGLDVQNQREADLFAAHARAIENPTDEESSNRLGEAIFGR